MAQTPPPSVTPAPTPAPQRGEKATFSTRVDAFVVWLTAAVGQFSAIATNVYNNAVDAYNSAIASLQSANNSAQSASSAASFANNASNSATAAAVTAGAGLWASGQTVNQDQAVISPLDRRTYRRRTPTGSGTTDPANDTVNYVLLSADATSYIKLGDAVIGSPVANIDFLNIFNDVYLKYVIEVTGLKLSAGSSLNMRMAVGGLVDSGSNYRLNAGSPTTNSASIVSLTSVEIYGGRLDSSPKIIFDTVSNRSSEWLRTERASGFRIFDANGGDIIGGVVKVYGVRV